MRKKNIMVQYSTEQLRKEISTDVKRQIDELLKHYQPKQSEYLTRQNVADLFRVNLSTIHNWSKNGTLRPLGIGGSRVYFLRSDIDACLIPLNQ